ncbi:HlyD family secretion protein [Brevundimonas sp. GCM10030266]|uniref:HlyD family secretion protein n=1 Tax=Brevundimonas sp. GCM10030266 TaxID=3273386 RepID=UPI00361E954B
MNAFAQRDYREVVRETPTTGVRLGSTTLAVFNAASSQRQGPVRRGIDVSLASPREPPKGHETARQSAQPWLGEIVLARPPGLRTYGTILGLGIAVAVFSLVFVSLDTTVRLEGKVVPAGGEIELASRSSGVVTQVHVRNGQSVRPGQVLLEVSGDRSTSTGESLAGVLGQALDQQLASLTLRKDRLEAAFEGRRAEAQAATAAARLEVASAERLRALALQRRELVENQVAQIQSLVERGYSSRLELNRRNEMLLLAAQEFETAEARLAAATSSVMRAAAQASAIEAEAEGELALIDATLSELRGRLTQAGVEGEESLRAPISGVVSHVAARVGAQVDAQAPLVFLSTGASAFELEIYLTPQARRHVSVGTPVEVRFADFPRQRYGQVLGTVSAVSGAPVPDPRPGDGGRDRVYVATVRLTRSRADLAARGVALNPGMEAAAIVRTERAPLWRLVLQALDGSAGTSGGAR